MELATILNAVVRKWSFTKQEYPHIPENLAAAQVYAATHVLMHLQKNPGHVAEVLEQQNHSSVFLREDLTDSLRKLIVNSLRLSEVVEIPLSEIEKNIQEWAEGKRR